MYSNVVCLFGDLSVIISVSRRNLHNTPNTVLIDQFVQYLYFIYFATINKKVEQFISEIDISRKHSLTKIGLYQDYF